MSSGKEEFQKGKIKKIEKKRSVSLKKGRTHLWGKKTKKIKKKEKGEEKDTQPANIEKHSFYEIKKRDAERREAYLFSSFLGEKKEEKRKEKKKEKEKKMEKKKKEKITAIQPPIPP